MFRKLAPALAAPLLVLAACAQPADTEGRAVHLDTQPASVAALRAAPDLAAEAGSARFEMSFTFDLPEGPVEMLSSGAYDGDLMMMEMDFGSMLAGVADAAGVGDEVGDEVMPEGFDEPMQMITDGTAIYFKVPMLEALTGTSGWLSVSPGELGQSEALGMPGAGSTDPTQILETLRGLADDIEDVGREDIRGVATTHYSGTVDLARAIAEAPAEQRVDLEKELDELGATLDEVPIDVWIDADGLARRVEMTFDGMGEAMGIPGSATMQMDLFDYGEPIDIELPSPDEVVSMSDVVPGLGG